MGLRQLCRVIFDGSGDGELGRLRTRLAVTVANLTESIRQTTASSQVIAAITEGVARENKLLAERTREQADAVQHTSANMEQLSAAVANAAASAENADRQGQRTTHLAEAGRAAVDEVVEAMASIHDSAGEVGDSVAVINDIAFQTNILALNAAVDAAGRIGGVLEQAIAAGQIREGQLFDYRYTEIPGTDPQKHSTPYAALGDRLFPAVQEALPTAHPAFVYAITADFNGYVPTHNGRFCQPLTRDYPIDLAGDRSKRIFSDRVGQQVGRHAHLGRLQTYRRDTGELMFDISAPVSVKGRRWGGFRIGHRVE